MKFIPFLTPLVAALKLIIQLDSLVSMDTFMVKHPLPFERHAWGNFQALSGEATLANLREFYRERTVIGITLDRTLAIQAVQENAPGYLARLSLRTTVPATGLDYVYDPSLGHGVEVHVLDTGVDSQHPDLAGRVRRPSRYGVSFHQEDKNGHGTVMARLIAGTQAGVAKRCTIVDHPVADHKGRARLSQVLGAMAAVASRRDGPSPPPVLMVLALSMPRNLVLNAAVEALTSYGVPVVVAAGNTGRSACLYSPASALRALTVGAIDHQTGGVAAFSNHGECVNVFAPGVGLTMTEGPGVSGTSYAAALSAGVAAYTMGRAGLEPHTDVSVLGDIVTESRGWGIPNVVFNGAGH